MALNGNDLVARVSEEEDRRQSRRRMGDGDRGEGERERLRRVEIGVNVKGEEGRNDVSGEKRRPKKESRAASKGLQHDHKSLSTKGAEKAVEGDDATVFFI